MPLGLWLAVALLLSLPGPAPAWTLHVAAAYDVSESPAFPRALSRGLSSANREFLRGLNFSLSLLPLPLGNPDNRSKSTVDEAVHELCTSLETRRVLVLLVVGSRPAAVAVALAAGTAGLPVLWARNDSTSPFFQQSLSDYEVHLDPAMDEMIAAVRALLLAAHWHTFSIVSDDTADATAVRSSLARFGGLPSPPAMAPVIRSDAKPEAVFHRLAELQRATRGVVLLAARPAVARRVLVEAGRLHMLSSDWVWLVLDTNELVAALPSELLPVGLLSLKPRTTALQAKQTLRGVIKLLGKVTRLAVTRSWLGLGDNIKPTCWKREHPQVVFARKFSRLLRSEVRGALSGATRDGELASLAASFELRNLAPPRPLRYAPQTTARPPSSASKHHHHLFSSGERSWRTVGNVTGTRVTLDTIVWPGGDIVGPSPGGRSVFRVVTALAPPFVMEGLLEDGQCLRGLRCHRVPRSTGAHRDNMTLLFSWEPEDEVTEDLPLRPTCCYGFAMDLLENIAQELEFDFHLYLVSDELYGAKKWNHKTGEFEWNGIMGDLVSGAAHMAFAGLSISSQRSEAVDFTAPFYFGGVSMLAAPAQVNEIPLLAFLLPFSPELWIAIFVSLNMTAIAVAIYEWLSPFGLNPWGRQRSKNFSMASALWVMWGLLCGHLVAFKAPKSWPNKFLINVWGGFSVIFVASYTANIAALIAGDFFQNSPSYHDRSLLSQRVGAARSTVAEFYVQGSNQPLWQHMQQYSLRNIEEGVAKLRNGTLDMIIGDTAVLDYYRATDPGCKLQRFGDPISQDMYSVAMSKGFPLKDSISAVIAKYSNNGYLDILQEKWYGGLPCFRLETEMVQPRPLGVEAVAGVFLLLGLGFFVGLLILLVEHVFYKRCLPGLRSKPKGTMWRSRNVMFFSQKLYRFINCVELVSPHHAARELVHTLRQGHITSLFQKSVKRKEHEQRRRRKSKAQFFEMIQEIRRVQAEERDQVVTTTTSSVTSPMSEEVNDVRPRLLEETGRRIARHHEDAPPALCRKRSGRLLSVESATDVSKQEEQHRLSEAPTLPRHAEDLHKKIGRDPNELPSLPRRPEDLYKRIGRASDTNETPTLPRYPEDLQKRIHRDHNEVPKYPGDIQKQINRDPNDIPKYSDDLHRKNENQNISKHCEDVYSKNGKDSNDIPSKYPEEQSLCRKRSSRLQSVDSEQSRHVDLVRRRSKGHVGDVPGSSTPPPPPPPLPPPESQQPAIIVVDKEQQWKKREGLLKQQLSEAAREKQELLDRIKILERCIREPP